DFLRHRRAGERGRENRRGGENSGSCHGLTPLQGAHAKRSVRTNVPVRPFSGSQTAVMPKTGRARLFDFGCAISRQMSSSATLSFEGSRNFMQARDIDYRCGETSLRGYLALGENAAERRPGVAVFHEGLGLGEFAMERARR